MVEAYKAYKKMPYDRPTWDLTSVLYAVEGADWFTVSPMGWVDVDDKGRTFFTPDEKGTRCYVSVTEEQAAKILQRFQEIITAPAAKYQE